MYIVAHNGAGVWGGAEQATVRLLAGLQSRGHRTLLLCNDPLVRDGARSMGVAAELRPLGGDIALPHALALARRLRRERPDVLLVGTFRKLGLAAPAGRLAGVPRIVARIGLESDTPRNAKYRLALERCVDAVAVNAERMRAPFLRLREWTDERVVTIHNGVRPHPRVAPPGEVRRVLGIGPDVPVVGTLARLVKQKRLDRFLRVIAALPGDVHAIVAGEGEDRPALTVELNALGLAGRVHLLGHREDVGDVLDAFDVYLVTSDREGMSNGMLEAMAAGIPVVSTPVSGADEALDPLPDGRLPGLVVGFDEASIVAAVARLLADPALRRGMGAAALERIEERFSFERMLDRWEEMLAPGAPSAGPANGRGRR